jgi:hypothetical protein
MSASEVGADISISRAARLLVTPTGHGRGWEQEQQIIESG